MNPLFDAIDTHNIANGDESWFQQKVSATGELIADVGEGIFKGGIGAVVAGINSIANGATAIANFVGAESEYTKTYDLLKSMDDDLARYYKENEEGVEIGGFILGSFVPGLAGVKMLNAAKAGVLGTNTAKSSGLMTSLTKDYATAAKIEFASGTAPFSVMNQNMLKGLAQGFGSAALEATAFEVAVAATMFKSPVLDDMSAKDIASNILIGTAIGGGLGGILHGVSTVYGVKKAGAKIDKELFPYKHISELSDNAPLDLQIINYFQAKLNLPEVQLGEGITSEISDVARLKLITDARKKTEENLEVILRAKFNELAQGDELIGQQLYNKMKDVKSIDEVAAALINTKGAQRISTNERLVVGDVLFPANGMAKEAFEEALKTGKKTDLLVDTATSNTQGYRVIGNVAELKVTGYGQTVGDIRFGNAGAAFDAGYDLFRNANGTFSVNPSSEILAATRYRRLPNNLIVDFEQGGMIVNRATAGLADLATKTKPIQVVRDTVLAGDLKPIKINTAFNALDDDYLKVQARYIWAQEQNNINWKNAKISEDDLPLLEKAYFAGDEAKGFRIQVESDDGVRSLPGPTGQQLKAFIEAKKVELAKQLQDKPLDEVAIRLNVSEKWLSGEADEIAKLRPGVDWRLPRYAKMEYPENTRAMESYNASQIDGMIQYEAQKKLVVERANQNFANYAGTLSDEFPDAPNWNDPNRTPTRQGAGASLFGFANGTYGSVGAWAQFVGSLTARLKTNMKTVTVEELSTAAASINTPALRSELDLITNSLRSSPEAWVFHPTDKTKLILRKEHSQAAKGGKLSDELKVSPQVSDFLRTHSSINGRRQVHVKNLKASAGILDDGDLDIVYPPPINTASYKHFVFVEPRGVTLGDKKRVIVAKDEQTLAKLIDQVDKEDFKVTTKADSEAWHKAIGDYDFALGLNESVVDSTLKRKGVLSDHFSGNPTEKILDEFLEWHTKQEELLATRMVSHKYGQAFEELRNLGATYTNLSTSQFRSLTDALVDSVKDPYNDVIKTALDISRASEYKWWKSFNESVREAVEGPARSLGEIFQKTDKIDDNFVAQVNAKSKELGLGTPFQVAAMEIVQQNIANKPFLATWIAKAQSILSTTLLQWDFFNAINNTIATPILLSAETKHLISAIQRANPEVAGKLAELMAVKTPEGAAGIVLPTTQKLIRNALQNYRQDHIQNTGLLGRYQQIGAVTDVLQQERSMLGELTLNFGEATASQAESAIRKASDFGRKWTGNRMAEEMTRFVAADVMRQITDLALEAGVLRNVKEANEYIQLFVNKTQGNYLQSQRPIVFQGVVGQAISLFQTYQFNLMQQLFKYVGEGDKKSLGILLGLQGSIYGMNGMPAFNFLNTHIVGNASGNTQHRDLYYATYTTAGKEIGDWMMYGAGANALGLIDSRLRSSIYLRGDLNPRQLTVLPTNIEDIPVMSASVKFVRNLWTAASKVTSGADVWPTISQAIEHNGLSRPLAGLAQIMQGYTTTNQGSLLSGSQDMWNIAQVSRLLGAKPFDEAIALDALYRVNAYRAADLSRIQSLGSALKTTLLRGEEPTEQQVVDFATRYAKAGGKIENFNKFMTQSMLAANRSQVNKLAESLTSPFARQMQIIMGGQPVPDFINEPAQAQP